MKQKLLLALLCLFGMLSANAQRSYTFNATALNVDGLPKKISTVEINPDGKEAAGATELCGILANSGWDIVGFSEDFNFHSYLTAAPASNYYNFGEHGGSVSASAIFGGADTDGLGFACAKYLTMSGGTRVEWGNYNGFTDQGADGLVTKGFRVYNVTLAQGVVVDVYVLHMDADDGEADIAARKTQLGKLATYIKNNHNGRPVIILGDTNCRYTRDELKAAFIDVINADSRFTIKDAWVELMWGGTYPTYGAGAMMTGEYGMQKGEIVDKVFYINTTASNLTLKANSYLHDESVTVSDHKPVVVNFTLTDNNGTPLTGAEKEENWTLDLSDGNESKPVYAGVQVQNGTTYFVKNVSTGLYLKSGADYGTRAIQGSAGMAITFNQSGSSWILNTTSTLSMIGDGGGVWMDNGSNSTWTLEVVPGTTYQYYIKNSSGTLSVSDDALGRVNCVTYNANDDKQKWVLLTPEAVKSEMANSNGTYPYDATPLLRAADFDRMDDEQGFWSNWTGADENTIGGIWWEGAEKYNGCAAIVNVTKSTSLSQSISGMPAGSYKVSFEGFYRSIKNSSDQTVSAKVTIGGLTFNLDQNTSTGINTDRYVPGGVFRDNDTYAESGTFELASSGTITFTATNPSTTGNNWVCIDNIKLQYSQTGFSDPYLEYKQIVAEKVNSMYPKVLELNDAGEAAYDITTVINRYNNNQITSAADAQAMCDIVDAAYANAYAAHCASNVEDVVANMNNKGGDVTGAIINPSFETGDLTGWTVTSSTDVGVYLNSNGTYTMSKVDGSYIYNSWNGDENTASSAVKQTIKGLPNGLYELKAYLASFGKADGKPVDYTVFLTGNKRHVGVKADGGKKVSQEATLYFLVEDGTAEIGAVGGDTANGGESFAYYDYRDGSFFKADNFRLKYVCDVPNGRLKIALEDIKATPLDYYGQAALDIATYETKFANKAVTGDGKSDANAVYAAMKTATKAQKTVNADMTWAIENPSFETGEFSAWNTTEGWETIVGTIYGRLYAFGADGNYLFNTWNDYSGATNSGVNAPISQDITGLPNGTYRLTAMLGSGSGNTLYVDGNGTKGTVTTTAGEGTLFKASVDFVVADGTATIKAGGNNDCWYKADDFRLTLVAPAELVLEETATSIVPIENVTYPKVTLNRTIKPNTWSTFVSPFDIPADVLEGGGWDVKELSSATENAGHVSLVFRDSEDGIKKGVPYMVRNTSLGENLTAITMENVEVNTVALNDVDGGAVKFVGQYISENVPVGDFFISSNTFYQAEDNTNTMKGFRARFVPASAGVKSLGYSFDDVDFTGIEGVEGNAAEIIAIYGVDGTLRSDLQKGINIVKMSNGTTKKVLVK